MRVLIMAVVCGAFYYTLTFALFNLKQKKVDAAVGIVILALLCLALPIYGLYFKGY